MSKQTPELIKKGIELAKEFQTALVEEGFILLKSNLPHRLETYCQMYLFSICSYKELECHGKQVFLESLLFIEVGLAFDGNIPAEWKK